VVFVRVVTIPDTQELNDYHFRQLSRVYPSGKRLDSSNFDPQPMWNAGIQLVALNYQSNGASPLCPRVPVCAAWSGFSSNACLSFFIFIIIAHD
jgi:hypothetical protein